MLRGGRWGQRGLSQPAASSCRGTEGNTDGWLRPRTAFRGNQNPISQIKLWPRDSQRQVAARSGGGVSAQPAQLPRREGGARAARAWPRAGVCGEKVEITCSPSHRRPRPESPGPQTPFALVKPLPEPPQPAAHCPEAAHFRPHAQWRPEATCRPGASRPARGTGTAAADGLGTGPWCSERLGRVEVCAPPPN